MRFAIRSDRWLSGLTGVVGLRGASLVFRREIPFVFSSDGGGDGFDFPADLQGDGGGCDGYRVRERGGDHAGGRADAEIHGVFRGAAAGGGAAFRRGRGEDGGGGAQDHRQRSGRPAAGFHRHQFRLSGEQGCCPQRRLFTSAGLPAAGQRCNGRSESGGGRCAGDGEDPNRLGC